MEEDSDDFKEDAEDSKEATKSDGSDNDEIRGGRGRGAAAGRVRERTPPPRKASKKTVRKNLELHYEPLSMSNATSTSGLN